MMELFPRVDPIPLPAPVWLFKVLHLLTLALHFVAVEWLIGGIVVASVWAIWGRARGSAAHTNAAGLLAHRLPIVMAYIINLGVPPLLFTQVLYGRALYTSSILIGAYWLSVVFLVMAAYFLLYVMSNRSETGRPWGWIGLIALLIVAGIARIYSSNMTLMLRPAAWLEMYRSSAIGLHLPTGDPTITPRWLYMLTGGLCFAGVALLLLSTKTAIEDCAARLLRRCGAWLVLLVPFPMAGLGIWTFNAQAAQVQAGLMETSAYRIASVVWCATIAALVIAGLINVTSTRGRAMPWLAAIVGFANIAAMVVFRDGIRDVTLGLRGYDVWDRDIVTNWTVVALFLVLFVAGLAATAWMIRVVASAKETSGAAQTH